MDLTINLDHQARAVAVEVHDETFDDLLATKAETLNLLTAHGLPKGPLSGRRLSMKLLREHQFGRRNASGPQAAVPPSQ